MIRKYRTFLEARLDLYREMWQKEFNWEEAKRAHHNYWKFIEGNSLPQAKRIYSRGLYLFKSFEEARKDAIERQIKNAC